MLLNRTTTTTTTDPIREGRSHYVTTEGDVASGRAGNKATHDAERDDKRLLHDDVHVLIDHGSVLQIQQGRCVPLDGGSLGLQKAKLIPSTG